MSLCGGEQLRAVLDEAAVFIGPALYCIPLNGDDGTVNARARQRAQIQLHREFFFLATAIIPTATQSFGFERIDREEFIRLFDPANEREWARIPFDMQMSLYGDSTLNNPFTLPEYLLFEPSSLIGVEWDEINYNLTTEFKFLTLLGIEYGMQS